MKFFKKFLKSSEVPRAPRVNIRPLHNSSFELFTKEKPINLKIKNLSITGAGIEKNSEASWQALGNKITGLLKLSNKAYRIIAEVRHISLGTVGCKFISSDSEVEGAILEHLIYEITALGLRPIKNDLLLPQPDGDARWYVDAYNNELYFVSNGPALVRYHMTFLGNYIQWQKESGLKSGYVLEETSSAAQSIKPANMVRYHESFPPGMDILVDRFVNSIEKLEPELKASILKTIPKADSRETK